MSTYINNITSISSLSCNICQHVKILIKITLLAN